MASKLSAVKEVLGLLASDALLLADHDEHFFEEDPLELESPAVLAHAPAAASTPVVSSDDEENLDDLDPANRSTSFLAELEASEPRTKRRCQSVPSTLDDSVKRVDEGCKCVGGKNCFRFLPPLRPRLLSIRQMTEAIDANVRETYLAGKLDALARHGGAVHAGQMRGCAEQRATITFYYFVQGVKVCQAVFLFAHSCSRYVLKKVSSHLESGCVVTPDHGSKGAVPWNALNPEEVSTAANFIQNYADKHGLPQPAAPHSHNGTAPIYLPCVTRMNMIHAFYSQEGGSMCKSSFMRVRLKLCADIVIMKPREDVCATCSNLQSKISRALTEDERISTTEALRQHANKAINSRDFYR